MQTIPTTGFIRSFLLQCHVVVHIELSKAMMLTEFGNNRPEDILKTKLEVMQSLAVEPGQVVG